MGVPDVVVWPIGVVRILTEPPWPSKCKPEAGVYEFAGSGC